MHGDHLVSTVNPAILPDGSNMTDAPAPKVNSHVCNKAYGDGINGKERHLRFYRLYGVGVARRVAPKVCDPRRPTETSKAGRLWAKATAEGRPGKTSFFTGGCSSSHDDFKE